MILACLVAALVIILEDKPVKKQEFDLEAEKAKIRKKIEEDYMAKYNSFKYESDIE